MKIVSWNVAGLRGFLKKYDLYKFLNDHNVDIICFNETKVREPIKVKNIDEAYNSFWCHCTAPDRAKYGYSGVAVYVKKGIRVLSYEEEVGKDKDGRTLTLELDDFYLVATYVPNSGRGLPRLGYRTKEWDPLLREHLCRLKAKKEVIWVGDLNVIRYSEDVNPTLRRRRFAGNTREEKESFEETLKEACLTEVRKDGPDCCPYTYWSFSGNAFATNFGMRLDYCCVTSELEKRITQVTTLKDEVSGSGECCLAKDQKRSSDHAPVLIVLSEPCEDEGGDGDE